MTSDDNAGMDGPCSYIEFRHRIRTLWKSAIWILKVATLSEKSQFGEKVIGMSGKRGAAMAVDKVLMIEMVSVSVSRMRISRLAFGMQGATLVQPALYTVSYGNRHCQASKGFDKHVSDGDAGFVDM